VQGYAGGTRRTMADNMDASRSTADGSRRRTKREKRRSYVSMTGRPHSFFEKIGGVFKPLQ